MGDQSNQTTSSQPSSSQSAPQLSSPQNTAQPSSLASLLSNATDGDLAALAQRLLSLASQPQQAPQSVSKQTAPQQAPQPAVQVVPQGLSPQVQHVGPFVGPPTLNPAAGGWSPQDRFPEVEASVIADVITHELKASDLYKLDSRYRDKPDRSTLEVEGGQVRIKGDTGVKDYPSLSYVHQPLVNYFTILISCVPAQSANLVGTATMLYIGQLQRLSDEYEWSAVLKYHLAFFSRRRREMKRGDYSRWGMRDAELADEHLSGFRKTRHASHATQPGKRPDANAEICRMFNAGKCTSPCKNNRVHRCSTCYQDGHGAHTHGASTTTPSTTPRQ